MLLKHYSIFRTKLSFSTTEHDLNPGAVIYRFEGKHSRLRSDQKPKNKEKPSNQARNSSGKQKLLLSSNWLVCTTICSRSTTAAKCQTLWQLLPSVGKCKFQFNGVISFSRQLLVQFFLFCFGKWLHVFYFLLRHCHFAGLQLASTLLSFNGFICWDNLPTI